MGQPGNPSGRVLMFACGCWLVRLLSALDLQGVLNRKRVPLVQTQAIFGKDLMQLTVWVLAFLGNRVAAWRGQKMLLRRDGTLVRTS